MLLSCLLFGCEAEPPSSPPGGKAGKSDAPGTSSALKAQPAHEGDTCAIDGTITCGVDAVDPTLGVALACSGDRYLKLFDCGGCGVVQGTSGSSADLVGEAEFRCAQ
jgi:hypothetical protein